MITMGLSYFKRAWDQNLGLSKWLPRASCCPCDSSQVPCKSPKTLPLSCSRHHSQPELSRCPSLQFGCLGCLLYSWLLSPGLRSLYVIAIHLGCKTMTLTSPFQSLILSLPGLGYSYFPKPDPPGCQMNGATRGPCSVIPLGIS